ncbi:apyrase isoform X7 [Nasonia vitripennis]|uniref:Apyrase n=1 Tax=Nasonia vitripennis TaxID=7425 RepID=A0A7M7G3R7_NASVI|nr:apyrase isoform X7 [Nasonia vitripennis]
MDTISKLSLIALTCLVYASICNSLPLNEASRAFELSIIHFSDFHARFLPVSPSGGLCYEHEKCVGGIARVVSIVNRLKQIRPNAIFLNAGDCFQGTLYYDVHRGNITAYFMNKLPHDAITIGNHDFDDEIPGLASYVKQLQAPVVVTNIDQSDEPSLRNLYTNSTIIRKGDKDIGIIGVIFSETDKISSYTGKLKFLNEVETINLEAKKLKAKGVNIIIVLSHCGIDHDKIIAYNCPDVDVIVGGHSHILLYNGVAPSNDIVYDKYPIVVSQKGSNRKVLIVHASAFTKYMGDIRIVFDHNDEVAYWKGNPIYLDKYIKQDQSIINELQPWSVAVDKIGKRLIGKTGVFLNGSCLSGECNLANLITDAYVDMYAAKSTIALTAAISIQNSIPVGRILYEDLYMTLPYNNTWDLIELQGKDLLQVLENNVVVNLSSSSFRNQKLLQWSGLKVTYNLSSPLSKIVSAKARCFESKDNFEDIDANKWYRIVVDSYLVTDTFEIIKEKHRNHVPGRTYGADNLSNYVEKIKTVDIKTEGRMIFV